MTNASNQIWPNLLHFFIDLVAISRSILFFCFFSEICNLCLKEWCNKFGNPSIEISDELPKSLLQLGCPQKSKGIIHCKYLQWKYSGKTAFCNRLQLFNCIWIAVRSMQKFRKKVVKTKFYRNPNIAVGLMLKSSSKNVKSKLILLYFFFTEIC